MLRRTPSFTALDPRVLASGLAPDLQNVRKPLWIVGDNVEFIDGKVRRRRGNKKLLQIGTGAVSGIGQQKLSNGEVVLWFVQNNNLWRWDHFSIRLMKTYPAIDLQQPYVDFEFYGDWVFINRGVGAVDFWNGFSFSTVAEMPSDIQQLRKHLSFLLAFGTGSKGTGVSWSDANDVSQWVASRINSAGALYIDEFDGGIVTGEQLGPVIAVYSSDQLAIVSFIGSPFYFGQKVVLAGIGAVGPEAVTSTSNMNYGVSRQGLWRTNGSEFDYIDSGTLHDYLQENVNWTAAAKIIAARNDILRTIEFYFPMRGSFELNEGWSFDPVSGGFSQIQPVSFYNQDLFFGLPIKATTTGEIQLVGGMETQNRQLLLQTRPILAQVQSQSGLTDVHFVNKVDEIELLMHRAKNCFMLIGSSMSASGPIVWSTPIPLSLDESSYKVPFGQPDGIYWHLRFYSDTALEDVVEDAELVVEDGEQVIAPATDAAWEFDLQGFLLFGNISGAKSDA